MNFKEFYHKRQQEIEDQQRQLMQEMSIRIDDDDFSILSKSAFDPKIVRFYQTDGKFQETVKLGGKSFDVYNWQNYLVFISEEPYVAAMIGFYKYPNKEIHMFSIDRASGFVNLMEYIFVDYLLERYDTIESDNVHTQKGFWFYQKLAGKKDIHNKYEFYIKGPDGLKVVNSSKDMESTYGYDDEKLGYTYVLKRKEK
jgi:hypothetical protein